VLGEDLLLDDLLLLGLLLLKLLLDELPASLDVSNRLSVISGHERFVQVDQLEPIHKIVSVLSLADALSLVEALILDGGLRLLGVVKFLGELDTLGLRCVAPAVLGNVRHDAFDVCQVRNR
jgi:hypothetical protein